MQPTALLAALADPARWRIVELLAERPRPVGVVAQLAGLRQPQATKHLQALEQVGLVTAYRLGRRRVYALEAAPLRALAQRLGGLGDLVDAAHQDREVLDVYRDSIAAEMLAADRERWADGRFVELNRLLPASRPLVWAHWTRPELLSRWWVPPALRISECAFDPRPGGRVVIEYRDADDAGSGPDGVVGRAEGAVDAVLPVSRLAFHASALLPDGSVGFTARYDVALADDAAGTRLDLRIGITDSTVESAEFIAGIEIGWRQVLDSLAAVLTTAATTTSPGSTHV